MFKKNGKMKKLYQESLDYLKTFQTNKKYYLKSVRGAGQYIRIYSTTYNNIIELLNSQSG